MGHDDDDPAASGGGIGLYQPSHPTALALN